MNIALLQIKLGKDFGSRGVENDAFDPRQVQNPLGFPRVSSNLSGIATEMWGRRAGATILDLRKSKN